MCSVFFFYISPSGNQGLLSSPPPVSGSLEIEECKSAIMMEGEGLVYFYLIASFLPLVACTARRVLL